MYRISMHVEETNSSIVAQFHVNEYDDQGKRHQIAVAGHSLPHFPEDREDLATVCRRFLEFAQIFCGEHTPGKSDELLF